MKKIILTIAALCGFFYAQNAKAVCSNFVNYSDGQTLTAASLNSLQTNYTNCINAVLDGDTFTGNMAWHSGSDILMYSDAGTTLKFAIDGLTGDFGTTSGRKFYLDGPALSGDSYLTESSANQIDIVSGGSVSARFTASGTSLISGGDLNVYSDTGSTVKASIDGATGATIAGLTQAGQVTNCGISVSGTTFTIAGYDGTALSATNPCVVAVRSNTAGRVALAYFTANVTFTFGAASDTDGNDWGITNSVNWANAMPFFIGVIYDGTTPYFTISRVPSKISGSASTALCQKADTSCDAEIDAMILSSGLTLSNFTSLPITQVGWFKMTYATTGSAWTASTDSYVGFNQEYEGVTWTMPLGQMGAEASKQTKANGGTSPLFSSYTYYYTINRAGVCGIQISFSGDGGADGSGAVALTIVLPYMPYLSTHVGVGVVTDEAGTIFTSNTILVNSASEDFTILRVAALFMLNSDFANGTRTILTNFYYPITF